MFLTPVIGLFENPLLLPKLKGSSQADLGKSVDTFGDIIGNYERDKVKPSIEVTAKKLPMTWK